MLNTERYLTLENIPYKHKIAFSKFRCSNHKLNIEIGRQSNIPFVDRLCYFCLDNNNIRVIDCEFHAFLYCFKHRDISTQYLFNWYHGGCSISDFYSLMGSNNDESIHKVASFVYHLLNNINS